MLQQEQESSSRGSGHEWRKMKMRLICRLVLGLAISVALIGSVEADPYTTAQLEYRISSVAATQVVNSASIAALVGQTNSYAYLTKNNNFTATSNTFAGTLNANTGVFNTIISNRSGTVQLTSGVAVVFYTNFTDRTHFLFAIDSLWASNTFSTYKVYARTNGVSFTVKSSGGSDTNTVFWTMIDTP